MFLADRLSTIRGIVRELKNWKQNVRENGEVCLGNLHVLNITSWAECWSEIDAD